MRHTAQTKNQEAKEILSDQETQLSLGLPPRRKCDSNVAGGYARRCFSPSEHSTLGGLGAFCTGWLMSGVGSVARREYELLGRAMDGGIC
jgi:hypothetical protein